MLLKLQKQKDNNTSMQKNNPFRNSMRSLGSDQSQQKHYSLHRLNMLNKKLQTEKDETKKLLQKIKEEKTISEKIGSTVGSSILRVENQGAYYAAKMEEQKRKNNALQTLVAYYQAYIQKEKKSNYEQLIKTKKILRTPICHSKTFYSVQKQPTSSQTSQHSSLTQECQQREKQLEMLQKEHDQYIVKTNTSEYELDRKLDQVRTLRSERTVLNKVFDQFEKEIFQHQFAYKQLVIQRAVLQASFEEKVQEYEKIEAEAQKEFERLAKNKSRMYNTERILEQISTRRDRSILEERQNRIINNVPTSRNTYEECEPEQNYKQVLPFSTPNKKHVNFTTESCGQVASFRYKNEQEDEFQDQEARYRQEKMVKSVFQELKIKNIDQLPSLATNLDTIINGLFLESQALYEQLYQLQKIEGEAHEDQSKTSRSKRLQRLEQKFRRKSELRSKITEHHTESETIKKQLASLYLKLQQIHIKSQKDQEIKALPYTIQELLNKMQQIETQMGQLSQEPAFQYAQKYGTASILADLSINNICHNIDQRNSKRNTLKPNDSTAQQFIANISSFSAGKRPGTRIKFNSKQTHRQTNKEDNAASVQWQEDEPSRLEEILKHNRTTQNNTTIYSEEELVRIGRHYLDENRRRNGMNTNGACEGIRNSGTRGIRGRGGSRVRAEE